MSNVFSRGGSAFALVWLVCITKDLVQWGDVGPLWGANLGLSVAAAVMTMGAEAWRQAADRRE
ncbi:MAG TPA: hypothetical protein VH913_17095 [Hyphomicrobiaceae bacterium]|jgi:hypothetical protein